MATPSSSSSSVLVQDIRPPADPLPTKCGEIGFRESRVHPMVPEDTTGADNVESLPSRHPDTDLPHSPSVSSPPSNTPPADSCHLRALFKPKKVHKSGIHSSTIILLAFQSALLLTTIALWVLLIKLVLRTSSFSLLIHVIFALLVMVEFMVLERTTYKLRAERYAALHPGEVMPSALSCLDRTQNRSSRLALSPWNRPPLPTYAAVLMDSGTSTGDVEDNRIAIPPPPAYGITRGSRLVLAGFISEELRNESRRVRIARGETLSDMTEQSTSRPMSLASHDSLETRCETIRARVLEETLSRLQSAEVSINRT